MARIRITHDVAGLHVDVSGRLQAADLRRLEHACAPALVTDPIRIELRLNRVTDIDRAAAAFVERMTQRGAVVTGIDAAKRDPRIS